MCKFLDAYFKAYLDSKELPSADVRYSLNWCQGDGVAFYGDVDKEYVLRIAREHFLANGQVRRYRAIDTAFRECSAQIRIDKNRDLHLYDHYNTMEVNFESRPSELSEEDIEVLCKAVESDIEDVSQYLAQRGFSFREAECFESKLLHQQTTATGKLEVHLLPPTEDFDFDDAPDTLGLAELASFVDQCERGEVMRGDLVVTHIDANGAKRREKMFDLAIDPNDPRAWMNAADELCVELEVSRIEPADPARLAA